MGKGVEKNAEKAVQLYTIASDAESAPGHYNLAKCLRDGVGAKPDPDRAFSLFKRAAEQSFVLAYADLSVCYRDGVGTKPDPELAEKYKALAESVGHPVPVPKTENK